MIVILLPPLLKTSGRRKPSAGALDAGADDKKYHQENNVPQSDQYADVLLSNA
jgi:hypothetical protein